MLTPDPVEYANALLAKGQVKEALNFCMAASKELAVALDALINVRISIHASIFETSAKAGDSKLAGVQYTKILALAQARKLEDEAVERRYFSAMLATATAPWPVKRQYRHMVLVERLREVLDLPGAIAECGCFRGLSSWMICATLNEEGGGFDGTGFHIFDSFAGLSAAMPEDALTAETVDREKLARMLKPGAFACSEEEVRHNLAAFPGISYHPGWLPQSLAGEAERSYRFVHLDVDLYEPTLGALEYFHPRLVPGGVILTDDYGWPGARQAFDEFCARHGLAVEELAGNQALLRK